MFQRNQIADLSLQNKGAASLSGGKAPWRFKYKDSSSSFGVTTSSIDATWHQWIVCRTFVFSELSPHDTFHQSVTEGRENTRKKSSFQSTWFGRLRWSLPFICVCCKIRTSRGSWQHDSARRVSGKWMGAVTKSYLHGCHNCTIMVIPIISMNSLCGFYVCITFAFVSPVRKMKLKCCLLVERGKHITYIGVEHIQNTPQEQQKHNSADILIGQYRVLYVKQLTQ